MKKHLHWFIISTFVSLYLVVSIISTIHVIDFFKLSNPDWLAIFLAISFEIGAAASLASLLVLKKMNKTLVWVLFFVLTAMQGMGNTFYAFINLENFESWSQLFGLDEEELIFQKRVLSLISGAILPLVALGFIKSLVDYIKPDEETLGEIQTPESKQSSSDTDLEKNKTGNIFIPEKSENELIIDGGGLLIRTVEDFESPQPEGIQSENKESEPDSEEINDQVEQQAISEINLGKVETVEILNANSNRTKISDRPSPQVDPTLLSMINGNESRTGGDLDIYGGSSPAVTGGIYFGEGSSQIGLDPGPSANFDTRYTLIALNPGGLERVNLTFSNFNDPKNIRFYNTSMNVAWQDVTEQKLDLVDFFYPVRDFSGYQQQTFVIAPYTSVNLDQGDFDTTLGEIGLLMARAQFYADATPNQRMLYWEYRGSRYIMADFMMLTGQVKNGQIWKGWQTSNDVTSEVGYTGAATGGFVFSNPTEYNVKLTVLTAS